MQEGDIQLIKGATKTYHDFKKNKDGEPVAFIDIFPIISNP